VMVSHPGTVVSGVKVGSGPLDAEFESGGECAKENRRRMLMDLIGGDHDGDCDEGRMGRWTSPNDDPSEISRCHVNVFAHNDAIASLGSEGKWAVNAPLIMVSEDIECLGKRGAFPRKGKDPIITVCVSIAIVGSANPKVTVALQLGECNACRNNVHTVWFDDEASMLLALRDILVAADADIVTGYNINNFDEPFLDERAKAAKIYDRFSDRGRYPTVDGREKINRGTGGFTSKAKGSLKIEDVVIPGRLMHDMCVVFKREQDNLSIYSLNSVAQHYLGRQKMDVSHQEIPKLFAGSPITRERLASYCCEDTRLPIALAANRKIIEGHIEMSRCTGVPLSFLLMKGQQVKVHAKLLARCRGTDILVETAARKTGSRDAGAKYAGAAVLTPDKGFHDVPIPTLDFFSMYPTIILGHNLCYTTFLTEDQAATLHPENVFTLPSGDKFVAAPKLFPPKDLDELGLKLHDHYELFPDGNGYLKAGILVQASIAKQLDLRPGCDYYSVGNGSGDVRIDSEKRHGILPMIVRELLTARGLAKSKMGDAYKSGDKTLGEVYNQRQLALKSTANSVYGFTGAQNGKMPATVIAGGVTAVGRGMIEFTKYVVETEFKGSKVLYGDTDSVMVDFGIPRPSDEAVSDSCIGAVGSVIAEALSDVVIDKEEAKLALAAVLASAKAAVAIRIARLPHVPEKEKGTFLSRIREVCSIMEEEVTNAIDATKSTYQSSHANRSEEKPPRPSKLRGVANVRWRRTLSETIRKSGKLPAYRTAAELAKKASGLVTSLMCYPKKLEFEKVLFPWMSISRKRYVGCKIMNDKEEDVPLAMGIETRRRDNCELVRNTMERIIDMVMKRGDLRGAIEFVRHVVDSVYMRSVPLDMLIITSGYSKKEPFYATKQKHVEVIRKMRERDPASAPVLGDRVAFVIIEGPKKARNYEKAEEAMYALEHDLPIDTTYYVEHQLMKPVGRLMKGVLRDPERLFDVHTPTGEIIASIGDKSNLGSEKAGRGIGRGDPVMKRSGNKKNIVKAARAPTGLTGTLDCHAKAVAVSCLSCGCSIPIDGRSGKAPPTCSGCEGNIATACVVANAKLSHVERQLTSVMAHCYRCSESLSVMSSSESEPCRNDLCPFTYLKAKLHRDIEEALDSVRRFDT
jgi:DNA polymerase elongation subunit (family B)